MDIEKLCKDLESKRERKHEKTFQIANNMTKQSKARKQCIQSAEGHLQSQIGLQTIGGNILKTTLLIHSKEANILTAHKEKRQLSGKRHHSKLSTWTKVEGKPRIAWMDNVKSVVYPAISCLVFHMTDVLQNIGSEHNQSTASWGPLKARQ